MRPGRASDERRARAIARAIAAATLASTTMLAAPGPAVAAPSRGPTAAGGLGGTARVGARPSELEGVGIDERLGGALPMDATFRDELGRTVELGDYFDGDRPVVLVLAYYRCPMLCNLVLNGLTDSLSGLAWTAGGRFEVVTISIDPEETPAVASVKKRAQLAHYGREEAAGGWHFLTGTKAEIDAVADATGFSYRWVEERAEYAHPAVVHVATPSGELSRYLYGVRYEPATMRMALVEAADGEIGTIVDRLLMYCFHYDATEGRYTPIAMRLMRVGGAVTLTVLAVALTVFWRRERRARGATASVEGSA